MADLRDFTGKNQKFTGNIGERISTGSTGERDTSTYGAGTIRFNTTNSLMEYYTGTEWKSIDAPPSITNFTVDGSAAQTAYYVDRTLSGNAIFVVTGALFNPGAVVSFRGAGGANFNATTTTYSSASSVTASVAHSSFLAAQEPYDIRITNLSGLFAQLDDCLAVDAKPIFSTASGSIGTLGDAGRSSFGGLSTLAATDPDGDTITYSISSGALPTGVSLNTSTAALSGTASAVATDTTYSFTVSAATTVQTSTRAFTVTVKAPVITSYTSVSPFSFSVPSGTTAVRALVIGGGGGGGRVIAGGGGAGGMVVAPSYPVTPGGTISGNVGGGGGGSGGRGSPGNTGQSSSFGAITANGGGGGGSWDTGGREGGSGGGSAGTGNGSGGTNQGSFPAVGGTGYGFPGNNRGTPGGGGGGAGGGGDGSPNGGSGRDDDITGSNVTYAGGGGGGGYGQYNGSGGPGGGGNGGANGGPGTGNRGSGGGGGYHPPDYNGGDGGSGIVVIRY
jgi:hypothetical protein